MLNYTTLSGCQNKFLQDGYMYKEDKLGYESISEDLVSEFESYIKDFVYLGYELVKVGNTCCCRSKYMISEGEKLISLHDILTQLGDDSYLERYSGVDLKNYVIDRIYKSTGLIIEEYLASVIYLDCITLNEDRHLANISLIRGKDGYRVAQYLITV